MCGDVCQLNRVWCNERQTYICGNFTTTDERICSNVTFWSQAGDCRTQSLWGDGEGERCRGTNSGECIYPTKQNIQYQYPKSCQDLSDQVHSVNQTCPDTSGYNATKDKYCRLSCVVFGNDSKLCKNCPSAVDPCLLYTSPSPRD